MKKSTLLFAGLCLAATTAFSQATIYATAPANIGSTTQLRAPNGLNTHAYFRGATIVPASELTSIAASTTLSSFGFTTTAGADAAVTGTIIVYLQNTTSTTYGIGTNWSSIIAPMTVVYNGTITIPTTATTMDLPLTTPFNFTGGGLYVAYDFYSPGPYATSVPATYAANNSLANSHYSASDPGMAPTTLTATSAFRPCFRFGYANPLTNDVSVDGISALGNLPILFGSSYQIQATVRNTGSAMVSNVPVGVGITGANTFTNGVIVSSLAAGSSTTVTFPAWTPLSQGLNTITVGVPSDQNNANNVATFKQKVSCNEQGAAETPMTYTGSVGFGTSSGIIAAKFQAPSTATVSGANLAISTNSTNAGNPLYAVLLDNSGNILASSNTITLVSPMPTTFSSFTFTPAVPITASTDYYIGMAQAANTTAWYPVASYATGATPTIYATTGITGGTLTPLGTNLGMFGFEAVFSGTCIGTSVASLNAMNSDVSVYPNPASSTVKVNVENVHENATVEVLNAIGQVVISAKEINGASTELNVSGLAKGVYVVKLSNGKEVSNTKLVIER